MEKELHRILRTLDIDAAESRVFKSVGFSTSDRRNSLAGLHKARLMAGKAFTKAEIAESEAWLDANGFKRTIADVQ